MSSALRGVDWHSQLWFVEGLTMNREGIIAMRIAHVTRPVTTDTVLSSTLSRRRMAGLALAAVGAVALGDHGRRAMAQDGGDLSAAGLPLFQTTANLNLRSGPGTDYSVLVVIPAGAQVQGSNRYDSGFREVTYNGTTGWASDDYLTPLGSSNPTNPPAAFDGTAVVEAATNFRDDASLNAGILLVLPAGATVSVSDQVTNGFRYSQYNGTNGWVYDLALSPTQQNGGGNGGGGDGSANYTAVTTADLNLRDAPNGSVILVMPEGASVTVTGSSSSGFLPVEYLGTGVRGWASADYLSVEGNSSPGEDGPASYPATTTAALNLRTSPVDGSITLVIPAGSTVYVTGDARQGYLPVAYNGTPGWASSLYIRSGSGVFYRTTTDVNLREQPSLDAMVLTVLSGGTQITYAGTGKAPPDGWSGPFDYGNLRGYVWSPFVVAE